MTSRAAFRNIRAPRWNLGRADWHKYRELTDALLTRDNVSDSPEATANALNSAILKCALGAIPRGQVKQYRPFWNTRLTHLKKNRDTARCKAERSGLMSDLILLRRCQAELHREIKNSKRTAFKNFVSKMDFRKDGAKAHRYISRLNNDNTQRILQPLDCGNRTIADTKEMANALCKHYAKTSRVSCNRKIAKTLRIRPKLTCHNQQCHELSDLDFTMAELDFALSQTKPGRAAGVDGVLPDFLKNLGNNAKKTLLAVINLTWRKNVPQQWRKAEIIPVLKPAKPANQAESYRPISLTSSCCKVAERMITNRLNQLVEARGIIDIAQAGFRRHRGIMDHVMNFSQHVKDGFHRKMSTLAVLIDFKAAYDTVWRLMLLHKMRNYGISGNLFNWIRSFLSQREIRVKFSNSTSRFRIQRQGLPQGAVISCILFNLMINDIFDTLRTIPGVHALLYADDLLMWATSSDIGSLERCLNDALLKLHQWAEYNAMTVSTKKTTFQLFTLSTKPLEVSLNYNNTALVGSDISRYLGVSLDRRLTWKPHINHCAEKALKRTRLLKRLTATTWGSNQDVLKTSYKSYIRPVLEFGSEVTITASKCTTEVLDRAQNIALRTITGAAKSTPIAAMEAQTQIEPLEIYREKSALCFWERSRRINKYWESYRRATDRLKTQRTPITCYQNLYMKYGITPGEPAPLNTYQDLFQHLPEAEYSLTDHYFPKHASLDSELRSAALQTIHEQYPRAAWLHIYTDGSSMPGTGETGAAYYCQEFQGYSAVGAPLSNYDGEVAAIYSAAAELENRNNPAKAVFLVDSQAAIRNLSSNSQTDCRRTIDCRKKLNDLLDLGWTLRFQWIPSHVNISGNEMADRLAKQGTALPQPKQPSTLHSAKSQIKSAVERWNLRRLEGLSLGKTWESLVSRGPIDYNLPRAVGVAAFRMRTGHDYLAAHLHRIKVLPSPECRLCGFVKMNAEHLRDCSALDHNDPERSNYANNFYREAHLYWSARHLMAQQPRVGVG